MVESLERAQQPGVPQPAAKLVRPLLAPTSPQLYAELARAMAAELRAAGGPHRLLLGELAAYPSDSPHRASVARFIAALPTTSCA